MGAKDPSSYKEDDEANSGGGLGMNSATTSTGSIDTNYTSHSSNIDNNNEEGQMIAVCPGGG